MAEQLEEVTVRLTNQKVQFTGVSISNPDRPIEFDYKPPIGDGQGYNGLELLLMSLSGCSGTSVVYLLRKMGREITGFVVQAKGFRRTQPPIKFEKIVLEFVVQSPDATDEDVLKAIRLSEEAVCPVWQMVKNNVEVRADYKIIAS